MPCSRRQFLYCAATASAAWVLPRRGWAQTRNTLDPARLRRWRAPLPLPQRAQPSSPGVYDLAMQEAAVQLHPDLPPTRCWTYDGSFPGPTIEAPSGSRVSIRWRNRLPDHHFLPVDPTLARPDLPGVRAVAHVHGARVPAASDGFPTDWTVPGQEQVFHYPNRQQAAPLFYHDHAIGLSRLNVYAGMVGLYWLRDEVEASLALPSRDLETPLLLCDRWLDPRGQLFYPTSGVPGHPWVPEVFGNCMLVNGALWPRLAVEPTVYRLRFTNAANSRFFSLSFSERLALHVIGSDQGLLEAPVELPSLLLAPAERADALVDFRAAAGGSLFLLNDGMPILRCDVAAARGADLHPWRPPARLRPIARRGASAAGRTRPLTLDEYDNDQGVSALMLLNGTRWEAPATETPHLGDTEIWEFLNLGDSTHPIHLHQVRFQILDRRPFDVDQYLLDHIRRYIGPARTPAPEERGWKDTVRCPAGEVTRIIVKFESYAGRYIWHCHILEHEANMMMRPLEIQP